MSVVSVVRGVLLPFSPLAGLRRLTRLPLVYLLFFVGVAATYLLLVECVKRWLLGRLLR